MILVVQKSNLKGFWQRAEGKDKELFIETRDSEWSLQSINYKC